MMIATLKIMLIKSPLLSSIKIKCKKIRKRWKNKKIRDTEDSLVYIHIGKCGGATLWKAINSSLLIQKRFKHVEIVHASRPPVLQKASYIIVIRNPIKRALSAFNWRYKLVVFDAVQKYIFYGEYKTLKKYETLNRLAEKLYDDGVLNKDAASDFRRIFHLKQNIAYHIGDLLNKVKAEQIYGVFATETLDEDISAALGVSMGARVHEYSSQTSLEQKYLSDLGYANLRKFLADDYAAIEKLLSFNHSTRASSEALLA